MSAAKLLEDVRASGIEVTVDGEFLSLKAANEPSPEVLETLRKHKTALLNLLRSETFGWSADDWRDYFEERAAISEFDHGLPRTSAETNAFDLCIQEWLRQNPIASVPGVCNECRKRGLVQHCITDSATHDPANIWLHHECADQWQKARGDLATTTLNALGLNKASLVG